MFLLLKHLHSRAEIICEKPVLRCMPHHFQSVRLHLQFSLSYSSAMQLDMSMSQYTHARKGNQFINQGMSQPTTPAVIVHTFSLIALGFSG